jgi:uncharacterized protein YqgC (DUF456 family)
MAKPATGSIGSSFRRHWVCTIPFYIVDLTGLQQKLVSGGLVILVFFLLYRKIETIGKISVFLGSVVILTILWIIISALNNQQQTREIIPFRK